MPPTTAHGAAHPWPSHKVARGGSPRLPTEEAEPTAASTGLGVVLLLLAALPLSEVSDSLLLNTKARNKAGSMPHGQQHKPTLLSTPNLAYVASLHTDVDAAASALLTTAERATWEEDEAERRRRRKNRKALKSPPAAASSASEEEVDEEDRSSQFTDECLSEPSVAPSTASFCVTPTQQQRRPPSTQLSTELLATVSSYLTLADALAARVVSKAFHAASLIKAMPKQKMLFVKLPRGIAALHQEAPRYAVPPHRAALRWSCAHCEMANPFDVADCRRCGADNEDANGVRRVFLGQLWKDQTVELTQWLLGFIAPSVAPLHIEQHTMKDTGRGKGCAWIYLKDSTGLAEVLSLHKRAFIDIISNTNARGGPREEGIWLCGERQSADLQTLAQEHAFRAGRPQRLPRQPVVSELPLARRNPQSAAAAAVSVNPNAVAPRSTPFRPVRSAKQLRVTAANFLANGGHYAEDMMAFYPPPAPTVATKNGSSWRHDPYAMQVFPTYHAAWTNACPCLRCEEEAGCGCAPYLPADEFSSFADSPYSMYYYTDANQY